MSPPMQITEDTPPDMLAGSMDLCVMLPNGKTVKTSVERSTPMMDLLVQVTTTNKISPAGHTIQALGERGVLPYKPSTPIGALDTWTINIVPKNQASQTMNKKSPLKPVNQPFEQTFRLQVHLPRNQLYVSRISPKAKLSDILTLVCNEKNLDSSKYSLRHPVKLDQVLNLSYCLADYQLTELALVSNKNWPLGVSSVDIMSLQQNDTTAYNFNVSGNNRSCESSVSSGSLGGRSLSPTRSDGSSTSPPPVVMPNRPLRKRRPAPKPPVNTNNKNNSINNNNNDNEKNSNKKELQASSLGTQNTVICHSRNSSDSSGYHEASVLSESPESNSLPDSLPRRSKLPSASLGDSNSSKGASNLSRSLSNLTVAVNNQSSSLKTHSVSSTSLVSIPGRKKKAAPPPPRPKADKMFSLSEIGESPKQRTPSVSSYASSTTLEDDSSIYRKSSTLPASTRVAQSNIHSQPVDLEVHNSNHVEIDASSSSSSCLRVTPVELPKPKPRTVFRKDSFSSDLSCKSIGDGSDTMDTVVNRALPRKSRKCYRAPVPKPRNNISETNDAISESCTNKSSQDRVLGDSEIFENLVTGGVLEENNLVGKTRNVDHLVSIRKKSSNDIALDSDSDSESSSVFIKSDIILPVKNKSKIKKNPSDTGPICNKDKENKSRNFSAGTLDDVPSFLNKSPQLGRWKNVDCLAEDSSNACGNVIDSEFEENTNVLNNDIQSQFRLDDDEIDKMFHNATKGHVSLESGMGEDQPVSLPSLPSPPVSLTNQPETVEVDNSDTLDWEYKLPAPPTFRDETSSPTVTEFDTVTIGNLTEVFRPESTVETDNKKRVKINEDTVIIPQTFNEQVSDDLTCSKSQIENKMLVVSKNNENNENSSVVSRNVLKQSEEINDKHKPIINGIEISSSDCEKTAVINELSTVISERLNKPEINSNDFENSLKTMKGSTDIQQTSNSVLNNFVITTYKETKPVEVFEDDSIKSSNGDKRDSSRNEATFRAPKPIPKRFEPNLNRRSSFTGDDKPVNISIKRSMSQVSLLAGNFSRGPYRSHLARSNGALAEAARLPEESEDLVPKLRKTTSELNICQGVGETKMDDWRIKDSVGLQSLQVIRSILPQLSMSQGSLNAVQIPENDIKQERVTLVSNPKFEHSLSEEKSEIVSDELPSNKRYSYCGPPSINLTTWNERPKRQVSIKMDRDYCSGFGKLKSNPNDGPETTKDLDRSNEYNNSSFSTSSAQQVNLKSANLKQSNDLAHVPIVRAVELKKTYSNSNVDATDFSKSDYFNGKNYENLNRIENGVFKTQKFNITNENSFNKRDSTFKSSVLINSKITNPSFAAKDLKSNVVTGEDDKISSVNSLAKRFGQQKPRPTSCYLFNAQDRPINEVDDSYIKNGNTSSRIFINANDNKKYTSVVGINGSDQSVNNCKFNDNNGNKTEIKIIQNSQNTKIGTNVIGRNVDSNSFDYKLNGCNNNNVHDNSNTSDVRALSKFSSGTYSGSNVKISNYGSKISQNPSFKINSNINPVVKGFRQIDKNTAVNGQTPSTGGGIPPPPPVMPTLKPVGERRSIKTLPPPEVDSRDQLLASIRNFGGLNSLKKISLK